MSPLFLFPQKTDIFSHHRLSVRQYHPRPICSQIKLTTFLLITITFINFSRVSPHRGCHVTPHFFYLFHLVYQLFFLNSATIFFSFGCNVPPGGCHPGRSAHLVTPLLARVVHQRRPHTTRIRTRYAQC